MLTIFHFLQKPISSDMEKILKTILAVFCKLEESLKGIASSVDPVGREVYPLQQTIAFSSAIQNTVVLKRNDKRQGFIVSNRSADDIFLGFDQNKCDDTFFTIAVPTGSMEYYIPSRDPYKGDVRIYVKDLTGFCTITELSY